MEPMENQIILRGSLAGLPELSHENHGRKFYRFCLEVPRLSGTVDLLPVIAPEPLMACVDPSAGSMLTVTGQIRSHNIHTDTRRRLLVFVFATALQAGDGDAVNEVMLEGILCREPTFRRTPLGREICDLMLAVPRSFRRTDYLPCILWGRTAQEGAQLHTRDVIRIRGRLQSRAYTKVTESGAEERITYEVSALSAEIPKDRP